MPWFEYGVIPNGAYTFLLEIYIQFLFEYGVIPNGAYTFVRLCRRARKFEYGVIPNGAYTFASSIPFTSEFEYGVIPNGAYTKRFEWYILRFLWCVTELKIKLCVLAWIYFTNDDKYAKI